ncbi:putative RING finger membrane protein C15C4.06c [Ceratocystis lukuohia]|uniref:RING finger membrane protein C15C4.06c n=1 Tax=Ceratocystis lukuohia TaxID=2019550 RepID=A0ABR4MSL9_9PEZI
MSLAQLQNAVLLFSNPAWSGADITSPTVIRNLTAFSSEIAYQSSYNTNLTTLSTSNAATTHGTLQGLLYVPEIGSDHPCYQSQFEDPVLLPRNVTKKADLPPANYKLIAIAPWYNDTCTHAYLDAARFDPIQGFIFYRPSNDILYEPSESEGTALWAMEDGEEGWPDKYRFPIYAIPGQYGNDMVSALSQYSGTLNTVPNSDNITALFNPSQRDYVRIWAQLHVNDHHHSLPLWVYFVIVIASLILVVAGVSAIMHIIQQSRRKQLERRIKSGQVDLEAMGIARVRVPIDHIKEAFPLFTYCQAPGPKSQPASSRSRSSTITSYPPPTIHHGKVGSESASSSPISIEKASTVKSETNVSEYAVVGTNDQPQCEICSVAFENRVSVIRQLPCFHIFHAECIEEFLSHISCLCPLCRQQMLPKGYCPPITNDIVHRERQIHRLRGHVVLDDEELVAESESLSYNGRTRKHSVSSRTENASLELRDAHIASKEHGVFKSSNTDVSNTALNSMPTKARPTRRLSGSTNNDNFSTATTINCGSTVSPTLSPTLEMVKRRDFAKTPEKTPPFRTHTTISFASDSRAGASSPSTSSIQKTAAILTTPETAFSNTTTDTSTQALVPSPRLAHASIPQATAKVTKAKRSWQLRKGPAVVLPPRLSSIASSAVAAISPIGEGHKSPGTIRRHRVRQYAQMLREQETGPEGQRRLCM